MNGFNHTENQINLISSIVKSTSGIIPLIKNKDMIDNTVQTSLELIIRFLSSLIKLFPEVYYATDNFDVIRHETSRSLDKVLSEWNNKESSVENFSSAWEDFVFWWEEYKKKIRIVNTSKNTIYLFTN